MIPLKKLTGDPQARGNSGTGTRGDDLPPSFAHGITPAYGRQATAERSLLNSILRFGVFHLNFLRFAV